MRPPDVVVIGGSAGGLKALEGILRTFQVPPSAVVLVVLHRPAKPSPLVEVLQRYTPVPVGEPDDSPWYCVPGTVTVAPAGYHLLAGNTRTLIEGPPPVSRYETGCDVRAHLTLDAPVAYSRPSIDLTFASAAELSNNVVTAVLLSCANEDGARGCEAVKAAGGRVVLQDPASCEAPVAVKAAALRTTPDHVGDPDQIGRWLSRHIG